MYVSIPLCIKLYTDCIYVFLSNLVLIIEYHVDCWQTLQWHLLWRIFGATNWSQKRTVKEQWHGKFYLQPVWRTTRYLKRQKYQNLWMNNKVRGDKYAICLHFLTQLLNICRKVEFLISQGNVATYLRWGGHCSIAFVANFIGFLAVQKFWKSLKVWQSYSKFKGGNFFLRCSVYVICMI